MITHQQLINKIKREVERKITLDEILKDLFDRVATPIGSLIDQKKLSHEDGRELLHQILSRLIS